MNAASNQSGWARLFRIACSLIRQVNAKATVIDHWSFGGGSAMMLQIDHRESHDVDLFLTDPQLLPFLDPQKNDFAFEIRPDDCSGDGARFLKLAFQDVGEIDFIVGDPKTKDPTVVREIEGEVVLLETIPEIITKKIVHRGASLRPRDIFDIAAAGENCLEILVSELAAYKSEVDVALRTIGRLNPEFVSATISQLQIRQAYKEVAATALDRATRVLKSV